MFMLGQYVDAVQNKNVWLKQTGVCIGADTGLRFFHLTSTDLQDVLCVHVISFGAWIAVFY